MKYDILDCFFPWRFFISSTIEQGAFPYWNPYQDLGYPIHADPSSGSWYPIVWLFSLFGKYSINTIGLEYLLHIFLAGVGFYGLGLQFKFSSKIILFGAIAYMLSGVFIGNAQHLPYTISACWLPFVITYYLKLRKSNALKNVLYASLFLYLMITGGYPAFTIILFYLLMLFFLFETVALIRSKDWSSLSGFLFRNLGFFLITILLSIGMFLSIYFVKPYLSRLGDFSLEQAQFSPFSFQSFISLIAPYATTVNTDIFHTDLSMRNAYFGLLPFVLFLYGAFNKKSKDINILFWFGIFCLFAAVGDALPIREFLFKYVPMMNVFRFPSVFRGFFILSAILTGLNFLSNNPAFISSKKFRRTILVSIFIFISLLIIARSQGYLSISTFLKNDLFTSHGTTTIWQHTAITAIFQILLLTAFYFLIRKLNEVKQVSALILVLLFDLMFTIQLVGPHTVYSDDIKSKDIQNVIDQADKIKFPINPNLSINEIDRLPGVGSPFWKNESNYQKRLESDGFNSFSFTTFEDLENNFPRCNSSLKNNKSVLLSDTVLSLKTLIKHEKNNSYLSNYLFFNTTDFNILKKLNLKHVQQDTVFFKSISNTKFKIQTSSENTQMLTLFNKYYTGWKAYVDDKESPIYLSTQNFMTIILPKGNHTVHFMYENLSIQKALYFNIGFLVLIIGLILIPNTYLNLFGSRLETKKNN